MGTSQEFFDAMNEKIDSIPTKEEAEKFILEALQPLEDIAQDMITKVKPNIDDRLQKIKPYLDQIQPILDVIAGFSVSLDPTDIIRLVTEAVTQAIKPYHLKIQELALEIKPPIKMYKEAVGELTQLANNMTQLQAHLKQRIQEGNWDIEVPEFPIPPMPAIPLLDSIPPLINTCDQALSALTGIPPIPPIE